MHKVLFSFCVYISALSCSARDSDTGLGSGISREAIVAVMLRDRSEVSRVLYEYNAYSIDGRKALSVKKTLASTSHGEFYHSSVHFDSARNDQADPFSQEVFVAHGKAVHNWVFNRAYSTYDLPIGSILPGTTSLEVMFALITHWPLRQYQVGFLNGDGVPSLLSDLIESDKTSVVSTDELCGGERCVLLQYKTLCRVWLSVNKNYCLMRRDIINSNGFVYNRITTEKTEKLKENIWMPVEVRIDDYEASDINEGHPVRSSRLIVSSFRIGDEVVSETFNFIPRSGSLEWDGENYAQKIAGGEDLLNEQIAFIRTTMPVPQSLAYVAIAWGAAGIVCGFLLSLTRSNARKV